MIVVYKILFFGIKVWVINLYNGSLVIVWINDCGLFILGRVIDLFFVAVDVLDMI